MDKSMAAVGEDGGLSFMAMSKDEFVGQSQSSHPRDENQAAAAGVDEELNSAVAAISSEEEQLEFWNGLIARDGELATTLFFGALLQAAADDYNPHPKAPRFSPPPRPPSAHKPVPPPVTTVSSSSRVMVLALRAPPGSHARNGPNNRSTTAAARAAHGNKPQCTPIAPHRAGKEGSKGNTHPTPLLVPPSTAQPDEAPPQNSFKTATVVCAPPHLARELKRPSTSTEGWVLALPAQPAKKQHRAE